MASLLKVPERGASSRSSSGIGRTLTDSTISSSETTSFPGLGNSWELSATSEVDLGNWRAQAIAATGWFSKKAEKRGKTKNRYFELQGALIRYFRDQQGERGLGQKGDILIIPFKTKSAQLGRVLTITNPDRIYELEAADPLQAAQWHSAITAVSSPAADTGEMGWWLKKAENVGKTQERYFEVDVTSSEIRYYSRTGPDGKGKNLQGKIRIHSKTVALPCDNTLHVINLARSWELTSPSQDKSAVVHWAKRIQDIAANLRQRESINGEQDGTLSRFTKSQDGQPLEASDQDFFVEDDGDDTSHSEAELAALMSSQISLVKNRVHELHESRGGAVSRYTFEELYSSLPPLPTSRSSTTNGATDAPNYTSIRSLHPDSERSPLDAVLIYETSNKVKADSTTALPAECIGRSYDSVEMIEYDHVHMLADEKSGTQGVNTLKHSEIEEPTIEWEHWEIDRSQIKLDNLFGEGEFGEVWAGKLIGTGERQGYAAAIAAKSLKESKKQMQSEFLREAHFMTRIHHGNLVNLYGVCTQTEPILIVSELCRNGSLFEYLRGQRMLKKLLKKNTLLRFMAECCDAMAYLEDMDIVHRDLAARNVLLDKTLTCKIADFGMAKDLFGLPNKVFRGNPTDRVPVRWCPPEGLSDCIFSVKSDVWSFGVLMYEIVTHGKDLYSGMTNQEVCRGVMKGMRLKRPSDCSHSLYSLMQSCWTPSPKGRASFKHLHIQLTTDAALASTAHNPAGLLQDAAVIIAAQHEPTYIAIKKVLVERYGREEFDKSKSEIQKMLNP